MSDKKESCKIGVVGDRDSILGFLSLGYSVAEVNGRYEAEHAIIQMAHDGFAVIFVTEEIAGECEEVIAKYKKSVLPAIVMIPSAAGTLGNGMKALRKSVEAAVGADILFKEG